ncbi:jg7764 [Pararge aegeria aegeria]|uniref:Jg7764 protein n=1 Tax=Pararge aegeria aegeria TaxID=348720 RepID=A0A8S4QVG9_9NEOP|nr:jg7764 [Pararge aegeria aegeria]
MYGAHSSENRLTLRLVRLWNGDPSQVSAALVGRQRGRHTTSNQSLGADGNNQQWNSIGWSDNDGDDDPPERNVPVDHFFCPIHFSSSGAFCDRARPGKYLLSPCLFLPKGAFSCPGIKGMVAGVSYYRQIRLNIYGSGRWTLGTILQDLFHRCL